MPKDEMRKASSQDFTRLLPVIPMKCPFLQRGEVFLLTRDMNLKL